MGDNERNDTNSKHSVQVSSKGKHPLRFGFHRPAPHDQHATFRLSGINLYLFLCAIVLLITGSAFLLVRYSPLSSWLTGDAGYDNRELLQIKSRLEGMQKRLDMQSNYIKTLQKQLAGEEIEIPVQDTSALAAKNDVRGQVGRIALDDTLRYRVQRSNINIPVRSPLILNVSNERNLEDEFLIPPIQGVVRKSFSLVDKHFGVDLIAPELSAVKCVLDGLVIESDWTLEGGNTLIVQHGHNLVSAYKHNSALLKKKGDKVTTGEAIAIIGNTGLHSDGPHVHFELWYDGEPIDPEAYIALKRE